MRVQRAQENTTETTHCDRAAQSAQAGLLVNAMTKSRTLATSTGFAVLVLCFGHGLANAQQPAGGMTLEQVREQAQRASPILSAARAAVDAATSRQRQAGAHPNPVLGYSREQTSGSDLSTSQDIAVIEQRLEIGGQAGRRVAAARARADVARARLALATSELNERVARVYADVIAADRRYALAAQAAEQFGKAVTVMNLRVSEGDVSGYQARRLRLEAARYAALAADAARVRREARVHLDQFIPGQGEAALAGLAVLPGATNALELTRDSIVALAVTKNAELQLAQNEVQVASADRNAVSRERIPTPALTAGYKGERPTDDRSLSGFVAGLSLQLPVWDRRGAALEAATADIRRSEAERDAVRLRVGRAAEIAWDAARRADEQVQTLRAQLGAEAVAALHAAETAYAEGEITLLEWLDTARAYQEAEASYATVVAESFIYRATLERLLGVALIR
jgi:cobalt-zinc-cadmium efflux system outer membrane protein